MHLPDGVTVVRESDEPVEAVLAFVSTPAEVAAYAPQALDNLKEDGLLWLAYPKTRGKNPVELNRDLGWDALSQAGYRGVRQIAFDETWSARRFRHERYVGAEIASP
jgi:hypothetical protein